MSFSYFSVNFGHFSLFKNSLTIEPLVCGISYKYFPQCVNCLLTLYMVFFHAVF